MAVLEKRVQHPSAVPSGPLHLERKDQHFPLLGLFPSLRL